jgi:serine/threonine-protein kinase HipA
LLSREDATRIVRAQVAAIAAHWDEVCREARVSQTDRKLLATRPFLNTFSLEGSGIARPPLH